MIDINFEEYKNSIGNKSYHTRMGKVSEVIGLIIQVEGLEVFIGEVCEIIIKSSNKIVLGILIVWLLL